MQSLFTFLVLLMVAAISTWLKNQKARSSTDNSPPDEVKPPPQRGAGSWEAELRRLLNEEQPSSPPPLPRPRPPIATSPAPRPAAAPPVVIKPVLVPRRPTPAPFPASAPQSTIEASASQMAPLSQSRQAYQRAQDIEQGISKGELAPLSESRQAYQRASQLDKTMSQHIDRVSGQRVATTTVTRRAVSPEVTQVVGFFRNARSARQAVIAAIILGPPRSLDETPAVAQFS